MLQREERGVAGKGLWKFLLGPRVRGRVWTEVAIGYRVLCGGKMLCKKTVKKKVDNELSARRNVKRV